jgi:hypothetical protein
MLRLSRLRHITLFYPFIYTTYRLPEYLLPLTAQSNWPKVPFSFVRTVSKVCLSTTANFIIRLPNSQFPSLPIMTRRRGGRNIARGFKGDAAQQQATDANSEGSALPSSRPQRPKKPPLTHFLCVPLVTPSSRQQLERSLAHFREEVSSIGRSAAMITTQSEESVEVSIKSAEGPAESAENKSRDVNIQQIPAAAVRPVGALHLTIGVMSLADPDKVNAAFQMLQELDLAALLRQPVKVWFLQLCRV